MMLIAKRKLLLGAAALSAYAALGDQAFASGTVYDTFDADVAGSNLTLSNGNLSISAGAAFMFGVATEGKTAGKYYCEFTLTAGASATPACGVVSSVGAGFGNGNNFLGTTNTAWGFYTSGTAEHNGAGLGTAGSFTYTNGDTVGLAIDCDNGKLWARKNSASTWWGLTGTPQPATNTGGYDISGALANGLRVLPCCDCRSTAVTWTVNFGATSFVGAVPSGFTSGWPKTFTNYFGSWYTNGAGGTQNFPNSANTNQLCKYTSSVIGKLLSLQVPYLGAVTDIKGVIYDSDGTGGAPSTLLGVSNAVASGNGELTLSFASGPNITSSHAYWIGVTSDSAPQANYALNIGTALTHGSTDVYSSPSSPYGVHGGDGTLNKRSPMLAMVQVPPSQTGQLTILGAGD